MEINNQQHPQPQHGGQRPGRGRGRGRGRGAGRAHDSSLSHHGAHSAPVTTRVMRELPPMGHAQNKDASTGSPLAPDPGSRPAARGGYGSDPTDQCQPHSATDPASNLEKLAAREFDGATTRRDQHAQALSASGPGLYNESRPGHHSGPRAGSDRTAQPQREMPIPSPANEAGNASAENGQSLDEMVRTMLLRDSNRPAESATATVPQAPTQSGPVGDQAEKQSSKKRLTQAQRRQGMSNKLDLSNPPTSQNTTNVGPQDVYRPGGVHEYERSNWAPHYYNPGSPFSVPRRPENLPPGMQSSPPTAPRYMHQMPAASPSHHPSFMQPPQSPPFARSAHNSQFSPVAVPNDFHRQSWGHQAHQPTGHAVRSSADFSQRPAGPPGRRLFDPNPRHRQDSLPPVRQAEFLDRLAAEVIPQMAVTPDETQEHAKIQTRIRDIVRHALVACEETKQVPEDSIQLVCFGSLASGFGMRGSDSDLMLFYDESTLGEAQQAAVPRMIEKALLDQGHGARLLTRTRVPIIRFCSNPAADLLEALRLERAKWEEEKDKLPDKEGESGEERDEKEAAGDDDQNHDNDDGHEEDEDGEEEEGEDAGSAVDEADTTVQADEIKDKDQNVSEKDAKKGKKKSKRRKGKKAGGKDAEKGDEEPKETGPPPYNNDEERLQLYRLAMKEAWFSTEERLLIKHFSVALDNAAGNAEDENLVAARKALDALPNVLSRYREPRKRRQELEFPEGSGLLCDINFSIGAHSNPLGVHNTRMLHCYSRFDPRITEMVVFVKGWAKRRKINKPYHGTLSSYGYVLMVLHYVVNVANPPLAPNLQLLHARNAISQRTFPETCGEYDIRFWQDLDGIRQAAEWEFVKNRSSIGQLLAGFFRYYAVHDYRGQRGFEWMKDVLSLRTPGGLLTKEEKGWTGKVVQSSEAEDAVAKKREITHRYLVAIEDPFEHSHNVGRPVMHHGIVAIREEFRRANQLIISGGFRNGQFEGLFDAGEEREREHRYFGPNPKFKKPPVTGPKNAAGGEQKKAPEKVEKATVDATVKAETNSEAKAEAKTEKKNSVDLNNVTAGALPIPSAEASQTSERAAGTFKLTLEQVHAHQLHGSDGTKPANIGPVHDVGTDEGGADHSKDDNKGAGVQGKKAPRKRFPRRSKAKNENGGSSGAGAEVGEAGKKGDGNAGSVGSASGVNTGVQKASVESS